MDFIVSYTPALAQSDVSCRLSARFNRQVHPDPAVERNVEATWQSRHEANPRLFNGCKFRLHTCGAVGFGPDAKGSTAAQSLRLDLGLTDYRSFLGTNAAGADVQQRLQLDGRGLCSGDGDAFLSQKLGVGGVTVTADGFFV